MIPLKNQAEISLMIEGGRRLSLIFAQLLRAIKPGITAEEIELLACNLIKESGGEPSFKMVRDYAWATCLNLNQGIVHGIPRGFKINNGDLVSLDLGLFYQGFNTDMAYTFQVGKSSLEVVKFLNTGKKALQEAIDKARPGTDLVEVSRAIQSTIEGAGYACVRELTGHGVGRRLHEEPMIPCLFDPDQQGRYCLRSGMTLAIEVIYTLGHPDLWRSDDGWTISTRDGKISSLFEKTIAITNHEAMVLTPYLWQDERSKK